MARSYLRQAEERIRHASEALRSGNFPYVMRQCQEAVELSLKASLRLVGIEPPKWHDVGPVLRQNADRFSKWFRGKIPRMSSISRKLRRRGSLACTEMRKRGFLRSSSTPPKTLAKPFPSLRRFTIYAISY